MKNYLLISYAAFVFLTIAAFICDSNDSTISGLWLVPIYLVFVNSLVALALVVFKFKVK